MQPIASLAYHLLGIDDSRGPLLSPPRLSSILASKCSVYLRFFSDTSNPRMIEKVRAGTGGGGDFELVQYSTAVGYEKFIEQKKSVFPIGFTFYYLLNLHDLPFSSI